MHISKIIHYCWFGGKPLPKTAIKCIQSWKKYCPDYKIIEWNDKNFDINCNAYCAEMFKQKKWAFLSDYVRLKVIYKYGGIYLDTDVQLIKSLDDLILEGAYMGFENTGRVATGLGFAAEKGNPIIYENMKYYDDLRNFDSLKSCPYITTEILQRHGLTNNTTIVQKIDGFTIYPEEYLCPKNERTGLTKITKNTYSIHHFDASWFEESWKKGQKKRWRDAKIDYYIHIPNRILKRIIGSKNYNRIKLLFRKLS